MKKSITKRHLVHLVMKISVPIAAVLLFVQLTFAKSGHGQDMLSKKVSIQFENADLKTALNEITSLTKVRFSYVSSMVRNHRVTLSVRNEPLETVLEKLLTPLRIAYRVSDDFIILDKQSTSEPSPQNNPPSSIEKQGSGEHSSVFIESVIAGKVLAENKEPLPGVSIVLKGTQQGTTTNVEGEFQLTVEDKNAVLVFSFVGYLTQEVIIGSKTNIDVILKVDDKSLDEVVVVGYGTMKKSDLTGAVSQIKGEVISERNAVQLSQSLQGTIAGLTVTRNGSEPNASATIRIRGITTIGTSDPLVIIDGVPGSLDRVNANDVENVSVLKDAASASIYGSRAASGVILITTKRAGKGQPSLTYNYEFGIESPTRIPKEVDPQTYMRTYNEQTWNDNGNIPNLEYSMFSKDLVDNYLTSHKEDPDKYPITDWFGMLVKKNAPRQSHNLNFMAGGEYVRTKAAFDYAKMDGIYPHRSYNRITFRVNNDFQITKKLSGIVDINGIRSDNDSPRTIVSPNTIPPGRVYPALWSDGRIAEGLSGANPYAQITEGGFIKSKENTFSGRIGLDFKPFANFKLSGVFSPTQTVTSGKNFSKAIPYTRYNDPNTQVGFIQGYATTNLVESRGETFSHITQFLASYTKEIALHGVDALVGYENFYSNSGSITATRNNYLLNSFPYLNLGNANFQYNSGGASELAYRSVFGRVNYNYKNRYHLQLNGRYDASSRFAPGYRGAFFPSVSAGWTISDESFVSKVSWLTFLKVRGSWGVLGNERIGDNYPYQSTIGFVTSSVYKGNTPTALQGAAVNRYAIPNISWETTETYDVGLDVSLFRNRLSLVLDYYKKTTRDMLLELEIPKYIGLANPNQNAGQMYTKGWEFEAGWNDNVGQVRYSASVNISDSRSVMGDLKGSQFLGNQIKREGSEFNEWYGYKTDGLFQTQAEVDNYPKINTNVRPGDIKFMDISGPNGVPDGRISPEYDRVLLGGSLPRYLYGGNIKASYKNIDLSLAIQGIGMQNAQIQQLWVQAYSFVPELPNGKYWSVYNSPEQNKAALYPRATWNYGPNNYPNISDFWLFKGAYMRLKNIAIGYTLPQTLTERIGIKRARIYATGSDLLSLSKFPNDRDPEGSSNFVTTSYVFGISVNF
jgi:TonB-linked SusC/RagA family outer membrane protein